MYIHQDLTYQIIAAAIEVHKNLGPGLLEAVYRSCLALELESRGLKYKKEVAIPLLYKNKKIDHCFRLDFLVEDKIILELKSIETMLPVHKAQLLTYLRLARQPIGLLINFNVSVLKAGIHRCILNIQESHRSSDLKVSDFLNTEEELRHGDAEVERRDLYAKSSKCYRPFLNEVHTIEEGKPF